MTTVDQGPKSPKQLTDFQFITYQLGIAVFFSLILCAMPGHLTLIVYFLLPLNFALLFYSLIIKKLTDSEKKRAQPARNTFLGSFSLRAVIAGNLANTFSYFGMVILCLVVFQLMLAHQNSGQIDNAALKKFLDESLFAITVNFSTAVIAAFLGGLVAAKTANKASFLNGVLSNAFMFSVFFFNGESPLQGIPKLIDDYITYVLPFVAVAGGYFYVKFILARPDIFETYKLGVKPRLTIAFLMVGIYVLGVEFGGLIGANSSGDKSGFLIGSFVLIDLIVIALVAAMFRLNAWMMKSSRNYVLAIAGMLLGIFLSLGVGMFVLFHFFM